MELCSLTGVNFTKVVLQNKMLVDGQSEKKRWLAREGWSYRTSIRTCCRCVRSGAGHTHCNVTVYAAGHKLHPGSNLQASLSCLALGYMHVIKTQLAGHRSSQGLEIG
ncbi:hypothetical protein GUJ93_ZPchr0006g43851 [Zizania palustris]|uniref:Uncharacterized protein n=1 Tax=Zizania palustris TaxID=103762 RepID=A0A8J5W2F0_ZIZPA|nr:hypothetical protein GUJ93_ZPchr0006g43851 [Zizania palustris]